MARSGPRSKSMPRTVPAQPQAHSTARGGAGLPRRLRHANRASAGHTKITARGTITKGALTGTIQVMCRLTIRECQPTPVPDMGLDLQYGQLEESGGDTEEKRDSEERQESRGSPGHRRAG